MSGQERDPAGADGLSVAARFLLARSANRAYPSLLPPQTDDMAAWRLRRMRTALAEGRYADDRPPRDTR